uniref:Fatty acid binding protein 6, ileal (gastrotropin) n=1 Tax=Oncorhynchus tshawytscha TaxID=74940 RepID=A0AAZ3QR27_ONCTS
IGPSEPRRRFSCLTERTPPVRRRLCDPEILEPPTQWETETQEGYEEFCKLVGIPDDVIEKGRDYKLITEVVQNGNEFSWSQLYPTNKSVTNKFVIDQECDMETIGGKKFKATVTMEGGKLSTKFPKYHHTSEISGGKLIETSTVGSVVLKRTSKKI